MAWTALLHAVFYRRNKKPWYRKRGNAVRYEKIDGEPKHWDLAECLKQYFGGDNPPERKNLEFLIGLRNKIEHRHLPALDMALYGECQAALLNLEDLLAKEFGQKHSLMEQLAVSLQFSGLVPSEKKAAAKALATKEAKGVLDYVEKFRGRLPATSLNSTKYSFSVFLVPRVAGRKKAADAAIEFVQVDEASEEELERLEKLNVLIREKHIPIQNVDLHKPSSVVAEVAERSPYRVTMAAHTDAWKYHGVRPNYGDANPHRTRSEYCVYDKAHGDYLYTTAWIEKLAREFSDEAAYLRITGR